MEFFRLCIYFLVFSFCGWISETIICSLNEKKFVKRGFLTGPFIPIYGFGGLIMVTILAPFNQNPVLLYVVGVIAVTILEYATALLMENVFGLKLWDYSKNKFNYKGRIWLVSSLFFGVLGLFCVYILNPPLILFINGLSKNSTIILGVTIITYFTLDTVNSVIAVATINTMLKGIKKDIEDIMWLTDQGASLDVAYVESGLEDSIKQFSVDAKKSVESILSKEKQTAKQEPSSLKKETDVEYKTNWFQRRIINSYPNMSFKKHSDEFNKLREKISTRNKKK